MFWAGMAFLGFLQMTGALLNLLPVPGLGRLRRARTTPEPAKRSARWQPAKQWAFFVLLLLLIATPLNQYFFAVVRWFFDLSGVDSGLVGDGFDLTQFWSAWL